MRVAWAMKLKPGCEDIHSRSMTISGRSWPIFSAARGAGLQHLRYGLTLFAYLERDEREPSGRPHDPIILRWWKMMEPNMEYNPHSTPSIEPIEEAFHMD